VGRGVLALNHRQRRSLAKYVCTIGAELGLRDWELSFPCDAPADTDALASVECIYGRRRAAIRFSEDWLAQTPEDQRNAVVHELIHIHFAQERQAVEDALNALGRDAQALATDAFRVGHEYGVDGLASAIADHFPLWVP
jgi:hypothetical protein